MPRPDLINWYGSRNRKKVEVLFALACKNESHAMAAIDPCWKWLPLPFLDPPDALFTQIQTGSTWSCGWPVSSVSETK